MALRTILAAVGGGTARDGTIELACRLAKRYEAHVEGFHVRVDPREFLAAAVGDGFAGGMLSTDDWMAQVTANADALAAGTKAAFEAAAARFGLPAGTRPSRISGSARWHEEIGYGPFLVGRRARYFDLVILGRSERVLKRPHSDTIEETLLQSGRPVLLAPADLAVSVGEHIAVAWNGSVEAVRSLASSLPLLAGAGKVTIVTVGETEHDPIAPLVDYLAWHGIAASHRAVPAAGGVGLGEQLLTAARGAGADLLVMGGYGHKPWREYLFGGATREIIESGSMPLLLSH